MSKVAPASQQQTSSFGRAKTIAWGSGGKSVEVDDLAKARHLNCLQALMYPHTTPNLVRQWIVLLCTIFYLLYLPFPVFYKPALNDVDALFYVSYGCDLILFADMLLEFFSAYEDNWGTIITDRKKCYKRYLYGDFKLDLISILPLDTVVKLLFDLSADHAFYFSLRLLRIIRGYHLFYDEILQSNAMTWRVAKQLFNFMLVSHWIGGLFFGIGRWQGDTRNEWTGDPWIKSIGENGIVDADLTTQVTTSIYYAVVTILTVGYGDITPITNVEKIVSVICIIGGSIFYAFLFGNVNLLLETLNAASIKHRSDLDSVDQACELYNVPLPLRERLANTLNQLYDIHVGGVDIDTVISDLSPDARASVLIYLRGDLVRKMPWFANTPVDFVKHVVLCLRHSIYLEGENIFYEGSLTLGMGFVCEGYLVGIKNIDHNAQALLEDHSNFIVEHGKETNFNAVNMVLGLRQWYDLYAIKTSEVAYLSKANYEEVLMRFPGFGATFKHTASITYERMKAENKNMLGANGGGEEDTLTDAERVKLLEDKIKTLTVSHKDLNEELDALLNQLRPK